MNYEGSTQGLSDQVNEEVKEKDGGEINNLRNVGQRIKHERNGTVQTLGVWSPERGESVDQKR